MMDWELLHTFAMTLRYESLSAAARAMGISQSTVSRRLSALERQAGTPLLLRQTPTQATLRGQKLLAAIQPMLQAANDAGTVLTEQPEISGTVTLTTVGEILRWYLVDNLKVLNQRHPLLKLRILATNKIQSLAIGEADISVRMSQPVKGDLITRALWSVRYAVYASPTLQSIKDAPWIGLTGSLAEIPEQQFARELFANHKLIAEVEDVEALGLLVQRGIGLAVLSSGLAARLPNLNEIPLAAFPKPTRPAPDRQAWLVVPRKQVEIPRVRAVMDWLIGIFEGHKLS